MSRPSHSVCFVLFFCFLSWASQRWFQPDAGAEGWFMLSASLGFLVTNGGDCYGENGGNRERITKVFTRGCGYGSRK